MDEGTVVAAGGDGAGGKVEEAQPETLRMQTANISSNRVNADLAFTAVTGIYLCQLIIRTSEQTYARNIFIEIGPVKYPGE
ncbi:hypothetical protein [Roseiflexus sp.]|uniref:hypothetical protein n=1 Tax=Roseiflexus sp. TaxID=2562120 RepID=UPI00398B05D8